MKTEAATWSSPGGWDAEDETLTWSPGGGPLLERMAPRLYSVAAASPGCSGRRPLLCKNHRSYGSLLPARHGWTEAACLHTANRDGSFISLCKQCVIRANDEITAICPRYTACKWNVNWGCVRTIKNQINAGSQMLESTSTLLYQDVYRLALNIIMDSFENLLRTHTQTSSHSLCRRMGR